MIDPSHSNQEPMPKIARLGDMTPTKRALAAANAVPPEAYEMLAAKEIFLMMAPEGNFRKNSKPVIQGAEGLEVSIVRCPPGNGPGLHSHRLTYESFMCLTGEWEVTWGEQGEHKTTIKPFDLVAVPPDIFRAFTNISAEPALLLVLVQGAKEHVMGDIAYSSKLGDEIVRKFGSEAAEGLKDIGITFSKTDASIKSGYAIRLRFGRRTRGCKPATVRR